MTTTMLSPGVQVQIIDESNYSPGTAGTVPLVVVATAANKLNANSTLANYTVPGNGPTVYTLAGQQDLVNNFGIPNFTKDASGNVIYGSETSEMGLLALYSALGLVDQAFVIRADIDLAQLTGTQVRPTGPAPSGTVWLDTSITQWGIFQWDSVNQAFTQGTVLTLSSPSQITAGMPSSSIGSVGNYAIVATNTNNPAYYKNRNNTWVLVGSTSWQNSFPTVKAIAPGINNLTAGNTLVINTITVTLTGNTDVSLASAINSAGITGVTAAIMNNTLELYCTSASTSDGTHVDGKLSISNGTGTPLTILGFLQNSYCPAVQLSPHTSVPYWKSTDTNPRPSGSVWVKTTSPNYGANLAIYQWNSVTAQWTTLTAPLYAGNASALYALDSKFGGLGIALDSLYVKYDVLKNSTVTYEIMERIATGPLVISGSTSNPIFTVSDSFSISTTQVGTSTLTTPVTITIVGTTASSVVSSILAANIVGVTASVGPTGNVVISQTLGGDIILSNVSGTPLTVAGITTSLSNISLSYYNGTSLVGSNWSNSTYVAQPTPPVTTPSDGTLWYAASPMEADIMINDGTHWRGYHNLSVDTRGFALGSTDPNGPQISPTAPISQSDGTALVFGDLWINTSNLESYPLISRWQSVSGISQWVSLNMADTTTENGILFADARWDTAGIADPVLDPLPSILSLLTSDYLDLDAPDPTLYPRGCLLFNTRRSNYNVKKFSVGYFNFVNYPLESLPAQVNTWVSASGKQPNNVPYFGRKAVRNIVVGAMRSALDASTQAREEAVVFNLICAPGYPELMQNMVALNNDRGNTAFIVGDMPMGLSSDTTTLQNYITNATQVNIDSEDGLVSNDPYLGVWYPAACLTNDLSGNTVAQPGSHMMLTTIINSDLMSYPWRAPAGNINGAIINATNIGYVDRSSGAFVSIGCGQSLRDLLYPNNVNPISLFPTQGLMAYGQKTRQSATTAMDRINVARLVAYMRYQLAVITKPFLFQPNDQITRNSLKASVDSMCNDLVSTRGLYDFLSVCDTSNNTAGVIEMSQLIIDIAVEPEKAVEFIIIPVRLMNPGSIASGRAASEIAALPLG